MVVLGKKQHVYYFVKWLAEEYGKLTEVSEAERIWHWTTAVRLSYVSV